jgi:hypothetical protein
MRESKIEKILIKEIKARGGLALKLAPFGFMGLPDRLVLLPGGEIYFLELKTDKGVLSSRQKYVQNMLIALGQKVYNIYGIKDLTKFINLL